jgi:hypothetical protein
MPRTVPTYLVALTLALAACGGAQAPAPAPESASAPSASPAPESSPSPASASTPALSPTPTSAPTPASNAAPLPTGGSVLIGEIAGTPGFDPRATLEASKPQLLACYNQARQANPSLHGKLKLRISVNESGAVLLVAPDSAEATGPAADPALVPCIGDALKTVRFQKPAGTAIVIAPLVFRQ